MNPKACLVAVVLLLSLSAHAEEKAWETIVTGPVTIKNRSRDTSPIKDVLAEGDLDVTVQDVQATLMNPGRFRTFMPYLKDAREISEKQSDGSVYVYTLLDLPVVGKRDYVVRTWLLKSVADDGTGTFENKWSAFPDYTPRRSGVTRLELNDGGWLVTPLPGGKCHVRYNFTVDPGGWIPGWAANMGNEKGVVDTFHAVEKEARRVRDERLSKSAAKP